MSNKFQLYYYNMNHSGIYKTCEYKVYVLQILEGVLIALFLRK